MEKIKSLEEQLVEFKIEIEKLTSSKLLVKPNSKEIFFFNIFLNLEGIVKNI